MLTATQRAEIARRNGARSRGPITPAGKAHSRRNSLIHGRRAATLAEFVPPESAVLSNENRQKFFQLFDQNLAKYRPADPAERGLVREITNCQWVNFRLCASRHALLNRQIAEHQANVTTAETTAVAYESATNFKCMAAFRVEYFANTRLIAQLERRLRIMQTVWPADKTNRVEAEVEAQSEATPKMADPAPEPERTTEPPIETIENKEPVETAGPKVIVLQGDLSAPVIAMYRKLYPGRDLTFTGRPTPLAVNQAM